MTSTVASFAFSVSPPLCTSGDGTLACSSAVCVLSKVSSKLLLMSVFLPNPASHGLGFNMFEQILNTYVFVCLKLSSEEPETGKKKYDLPTHFLLLWCLKPLLKLQASTL